MKHPALRRQRGVTLIEVLVAILIFSFGLLGFVGLQARAIQLSIGAEDSNRAALLANDLASTMVMMGKTDVTYPALAAEIVKWKARAASSSTFGLPNVSASASSAGSVATITIRWRANGVASTAPNAQNQYVTQVII